MKYQLECKWCGYLNKKMHYCLSNNRVQSVVGLYLLLVSQDIPLFKSLSRSGYPVVDCNKKKLSDVPAIYVLLGSNHLWWIKQMTSIFAFVGND